MLKHYLTIALRSFRRNPFTASVNTFALALGLTAFVMTYAVVNYWDRGERHFANADRTYVVTAALEARDGSVRTGRQPTTNRLYADYLRAEFAEIETVARVQIINAEAGVGTNEKFIRMFVAAADPEFLDIFDLPFIEGDGNALRQPVSVVLTRDAATRLFGSTDVLGRTIVIGSVLDVTVTGVIDPIREPSHMGRSASASLRFDVLLSWDTQDALAAAVRARDAARNPQAAQQSEPPPPQTENWLGNYCCTTYAMLRQGSPVTSEDLNEQLRAFGERHLPVAQSEIASLTVGAVPVTGLMVSQLNGQLFGGNFSITTLLLAFGGLVLIVACVNYANLATAQAARRAREVGLRKALGGNRSQVMLQYLSESALLTLVAVAIALVAARLLAPALQNAVGIDLSLGLFDSVRFWAFLAALLIAVTVLGGAYPALVLSRVPPIEALRVGRSRIGPRFAGTLLVGVQFVAASFLLIVVIVMYAQNLELRRTGLGRTADPVLVIGNFRQYSGVDPVLLQAELARLPQVTGVTEAGSPPWNENVNLMLLGRSPDQATGFAAAYQSTVGYDFFSTLGFTVLAGRVFDREHGEDIAPDNPMGSGQTLSVVIDDVLVRQFGFRSPQEAVDQTVYMPERLTRAFGSAAQPVRIIGVVASKPLNLRAAEATANLYMLRTGLTFQLVRISAADVAGGIAAIDALYDRLAAEALDDQSRLHGRALQRELQKLRAHQPGAGRARVPGRDDRRHRAVRHGDSGGEPPRPRGRRAQVCRRTNDAGGRDAHARFLEARVDREPYRLAARVLRRSGVSRACSCSESRSRRCRSC